jgi:hypothetical protein
MNRVSGVDRMLWEEDLDGGDVGGFGAYLTRIIVNQIATSCPPDTSWFRFLGTIGAHNPNVCCLAVFWNLAKWNETYRIGGAMRHVAVGTKALGKPSNFVGVGLKPVVAITAPTKFRVFRHPSRVGVDSSTVQGLMVGLMHSVSGHGMDGMSSRWCRSRYWGHG